MARIKPNYWVCIVLCCGAGLITFLCGVANGYSTNNNNYPHYQQQYQQQQQQQQPQQHQQDPNQYGYYHRSERTLYNQPRRGSRSSHGLHQHYDGTNDNGNLHHYRQQQNSHQPHNVNVNNPQYTQPQHQTQHAYQHGGQHTHEDAINGQQQPQPQSNPTNVQIPTPRYTNQQYQTHQQQIQDTIVNSIRSTQQQFNTQHQHVPIITHQRQNDDSSFIVMIIMGISTVLGLSFASYCCYILFSFKHTFATRLIATKIPLASSHSHDIGSPRGNKDLQVSHLLGTSNGFDKFNMKMLFFLERLIYFSQKRTWMTQEQLYFHITKRKAMPTQSPNSLKLDKAI